MKKISLTLIGLFVLLVGVLLYAEQTIVPPGADADQPASSAVTSQPNPSAPQTPAAPNVPAAQPLSWLIPVEDLDAANEELQQYLPSQCRTQENTLYLTAEKSGQGYISGKVESSYAFRYGQFSFRIPTVRGTGLFPALWLLPAHGQSYPEVDIYELIGSRPHEIYGVLHYEDSMKNKARHYFQHKFKPANTPNSIVLDFSWTPEKLVWSLNGKPVYTVEQDVPKVPMYFIANLAVGGSWPGAPDKSTPFPTTFAVEVLKFEPVETFTR